MHSTQDENTLEQDASFDQPLKRVAYEAGMLLGLEATRDEQQYHRRRLSRHQYWLHGAGTLCGMSVRADPATAPDNDPMPVRLLVSEGVGIDGFGRDILVNEPYCIDFGQWLKAQSEAQLLNGYEETDGANYLHLDVTIRHHDCAIARQPVLARKLNLSTDAVQPSRLKDSVLLELQASMPDAEDRFHPWSVHDALDGPAPTLNTDEQSMIDDAAGNPGLQRQLALQAKLLHALDNTGVSADTASDRLEEDARILLAHIRIELDNLSTLLNATENTAVLNPNLIQINNLVRPFILTASQLAFLARTE